MIDIDFTCTNHSPLNSHDSASLSDGPESNKNIDPAILDEEEDPLEEDIADDVVAPSKQAYSISGGGYNALKTHKGQLYSGIAVGGSHAWIYDPGTWKETKGEPDLWRIDYQTNKRRARNAPNGSGAPMGTEYHWLIVGHQHVRKVDANTYETHWTGAKYKLAHKSATTRSWSIPTVRGRREREIELLEDAQRRVQGLPPVLASEKVKVERKEKGQQSLDTLFGKASRGQGEVPDAKKRKRV